MKRTAMYAAVIFFLPITGTTQQPNGAGSTVNKSYSRMIPVSRMDQRKIYNWRNGQKSTAIGRQAGEEHLNYAIVYGDSAVAVYGADLDKDPQGKTSNRAFSNARVIPISGMNQRKNYYWGNGQRSTPMGRLADDPDALYAKVAGDSAIVVKKPNPKD